jgi:hypothetical protein
MSEWYKLIDKKPVPASTADYREIFDEESRKVALTLLPEGGKVSTVFLGLDHNHSGEGAPILFETMVFLPSGNEDCVRYSTWEEAQRGHTEMVIKYSPRRSAIVSLDEDLFNV